MNRAAILLAALLGAACGNRGADGTAGEAGVRGDSVGAVTPAGPVGEDAPPADIEVEEPLTPAAAQPGSGGGVDAAPVPAPRTPAAPADVTTQPEPQLDDGAAILRRAAAAYENVRSLRAQFVMHYENALLRQKSTSKGTLYQRRPDRIALRFSDPAGDVIVGDGEHFYIYYPSVDPQQVLCTPATPGGGGGVDLQAQFVGNPVERFRYTLHGTESVGGRPANVLTLVPRQNAEYRSLKVWLDTRDSLARRFEITEQNGTIRRFDLDDMVTNPSIPDATFRFVRPENARQVGC